MQLTVFLCHQHISQVLLPMWGKMLFLINEAINSSHLLITPLMFWWIKDKEKFELKLSDVLYLQSMPTKKLLLNAGFFLFEEQRSVSCWGWFVESSWWVTQTYWLLKQASKVSLTDFFFFNKFTTFLPKMSCWVQGMIDTNYIQYIMITITGITLFWIIISLVWLCWTFSSCVE